MKSEDPSTKRLFDMLKSDYIEVRNPMSNFTIDVQSPPDSIYKQRKMTKDEFDRMYPLKPEDVFKTKKKPLKVVLLKKVISFLLKVGLLEKRG